MGTFFTFKIADDSNRSSVEQDVETACSILADADDRFSLYKENSEVSRLNSGELSWELASSAQKDIKSQVEKWKQTTAGYFDALSPVGVYDPSGLVKTWAASNAAMYLEANGYRDFTLNAGGDVYLGPEVRTDPLTRVGLSNLKPISSRDASVNMILDVKGTQYRAVATSGSVERGEHIWRKPLDSNSEKFVQVSVIARDLVTADIWATALISGGSLALDHFQKSVSPDQAIAIATSASGKISTTEGFSQVLANLG